MMSTFVISGEVMSPLSKESPLSLLHWTLGGNTDNRTEINYVTCTRCPRMVSDIARTANPWGSRVFYQIHVYDIGKYDMCLTVLNKVPSFSPIKRWFGFTDNVKCSHWNHRSAHQSREVGWGHLLMNHKGPAQPVFHVQVLPVRPSKVRENAPIPHTVAIPPLPPLWLLRRKCVWPCRQCAEWAQQRCRSPLEPDLTNNGLS